MKIPRVAARLRSKPVVAVVLAAGIVGGPYLAGMMFPEASLAKQILGGWILGCFFALCTMPEKFLEL